MPRKLTDVERDVLIDHLDGVACRYVMPSGIRGSLGAALRASQSAVERLVDLGLLRRANGAYTVITAAGRSALSALLAGYADALLRTALADDGHGQGDDEHAYQGNTRREIFADGRRADRESRRGHPSRRDAGLLQSVAPTDAGGVGGEATEGRDDGQDRHA